MADVSFYHVLHVSPDASTEQIRAAFKRMALQVHPDKGGNKDSFQLVYLAFETLVDIASRRAYDARLCETACKRQVVRPMPGRSSTMPGMSNMQDAPNPIRMKKELREVVGTPVPRTVHKRRNSDCKEKRTRRHNFSQGSHIPKKCCYPCRDSDIIQQLYILLKCFSAAERRSLLKASFSQTQRLALEAWMYHEKPRNVQSPQCTHQMTGLTSIALHKTGNKMLPSSEDDDTASDDDISCTSHHHTENLALEDASLLPPPNHGLARGKTAVRGISKVQYLGYSMYRANVGIENVLVRARDVKDLATALDALVVLTSMKQRALAMTTGNLAERIELCLKQVLEEHRRCPEDLGLRFVVRVRHSFWLGRASVTTPCLQSSVALKAAWHRISKFNGSENRSRRGKGHILWRQGLANMYTDWDVFRDDFATICEENGCDAGLVRGHLDEIFKANNGHRDRVVQYWEQCHMRREDGRKSYRGNAKLTLAQRETRRRERILVLTSRWSKRLQRRSAAEASVSAAAKAAAIRMRKKQERVKRETRWRHMNRKDITMDDLLGKSFGTDCSQ